MNDMSNAPMSSEPVGPTGVAGWFSTWMNALTKPNEATYAAMATSPDAKLTTAFLWVFIGSLVSFFLSSLVQGAMMRQMLQQFGGGDVLQSGGQGFGGSLISAICGAPIAAVISMVFFAIFVGVVQFLAKMFKGTGTFEQMAYAFAAITTPFAFISGVLALLSAIPYVGLCFSIVTLVATLYVLFLQVTAVKGVNQFGWGQALGSYFLPVIVLCCCLSVGAFAILRVVGNAVNSSFNNINNSLP